MRSSLSSGKSFRKLSGKHSLEYDGGEPPYCLRSFKHHKVSASQKIPTNIGAILGEVHGTCNAGVTTVETACDNLKARPSNLPVKMLPNELKSKSLKLPVLHGKAPLKNVEMGLLRVPEKVELHTAGNNSFIPMDIDIRCCTGTSSMPCVLPRKYPPPKIRNGVSIFREFPQGCGRQNLDLSSKFDILPDGKSSEKKQTMFKADEEQFRGGSCNAGSGFARNSEGKLVEDIDDKVKADSEKTSQVEKNEPFKKVYHSECKFNQEAGINTITTASSPESNSLKANLNSKMTCSNNVEVKSWVERNGNDPDEYSRYKLANVHNSVVMHSVMDEYVDVAHSDGGKSDGCSDKLYELMGHKGSYYLLLKDDDTRFNDGTFATQEGVKSSDCATVATDGCSDKIYELMGHKGSYYLLLKDDDTRFNDGTFATQEGVKSSDCATVATDACSDNKYDLMGHKGSYYLLLKHDDTIYYVSDVDDDIHNVDPDIHNVKAASDSKHNSTLSGELSKNSTVNGNQEALSRNEVREVLNLFQKTLKKRLLEKQVTRKSKGNIKTESSQIYVEVAMLLKQQNKLINMCDQVLGAIPGVEVGDQFHYMAELVVVGVHVQFVSGIDYMEKNGKIIATSVVSTCCYPNDEELTDVLIYSCEDDNQTMAEQNSKDQTLVRGDLALKNSMDEETPVRVIRGHQSLDGKNTTFTYDGLYTVSKFWQERAQNGKLVYMFQLNKMQGQPKLKVNKLGRFGKSKAHYYRTLIDDISYGKEKISIPVVNDLNNDKPPIFNYISKMVYPQLRKSAKTRGCRCVDGCSDHVQCSCVVRNGGTVPFNEDGALIEAKPIVHECGPSCKCPPSCKNRVSQHGLKLQLEVFKTKTRGWGVRSRNFISSGSFVCEYVGELLNDKQAEERIGFDEYLFDIGDEDGFAIDAAKIGSVGRFVNHSCSPNLYAQDVLFDHNDKMMPHVMLFATKDINPLQELTYDYNYKIDHVYDSNGNVKKKTCHCGARKCTGRMY